MKHDAKSPSTVTTTNAAGEVTKPDAPSAPATTAPAPKEIARLDGDASLKDLVAKVNELVDRSNSKRDRGPNSTRDMTEEDAREIMLGKFKDASHTKAAAALGLSYGQVYSARKGFTYKGIYKISAKTW